MTTMLLTKSSSNCLMPAHVFSTKYLPKCLESQRHVVDDASVVRSCLVVHGPSAASDLQPTLLHQTPGHSSGALIALLPPQPEKGCLHLDKSKN